MLKIRLIAAVIFITAFIAGCTISPPPPPEDAVFLKINYMNQADFNARYGNFIRSQVPELVFEVIPNDWAKEEDSFADFIKKYDLDIVFMDYNQYVEIASQDLLLEVDVKDINGAESIPEQFLASFRMDDGAYYALPTDYQTPVIFYNTSVFNRYNVPYPDDQMTWQEVYELAARFPIEQGLNPFYGGPAEYVLQNIALTLGGKIYKEDMTGLRIGEEPWKEAWMLTAKAYADEVFKRSQIGFEEFVIGRTAMFYNNAVAIEPMRKKSNSVPVQIVTQPVHPDKPDEFPLFHVNLFGIAASTEHPEEAWEAVKWIDELTFQVPRGNIPARVKEWEHRFRIDLSATYKLKLPVRQDDTTRQAAVELSDNWNAEWQLYHQPLFQRLLQSAIEQPEMSERIFQQFVRESEETWQKYLSRDKD